MHSNIQRIIISLVIVNSFVYGVQSKQKRFKNVSSEGYLNFTQMANKYGGECEEHTVTTDDGYQLMLFHIPGDKSRPVLLTHGIFDSADTFMIRGNTSLAIALARRGFDVWAGNQRGNKYSRRHLYLNYEKDAKEFWDFTLQELGVYDLPAMIDYVLKATKQEKLISIGHSQGNGIYYVLGSEKPEYNNKIKLLIALSPIGFMHHVKSMARAIVASWPFTHNYLQLTNQHYLFDNQLVELVTRICTQKSIGYEICIKGLFFPIAGYDPSELEPEFVEVVHQHFPDTTSMKNFGHLAQISLRRTFSKYDYGFVGNLEAYNSIVPPDYDLSKVIMPIILAVAKNDHVSAVEDVEILRNHLPNVVKYHVLEHELFNHLDYIWGKNMADYLFPLIFYWIQEYA